MTNKEKKPPVLLPASAQPGPLIPAGNAEENPNDEVPVGAEKASDKVTGRTGSLLRGIRRGRKKPEKSEQDTKCIRVRTTE